MTRIFHWFFMWKMDHMSDFDIRLVFTLPPRDSTLQYKGCLHLWNNFPCIITLSCWLYFNIDHVSSSAWLTGALTGVHYQWVGGLQETYSTEQCHLEKILISLLGNSEFYQLIFFFNLLFWTYYISRIMDELVKKAEFRHGYVRKRKVPISTAELEEIYSPVPSPDFKHYNFNFYQTV